MLKCVLNAPIHIDIREAVTLIHINICEAVTLIHTNTCEVVSSIHINIHEAEKLRKATQSGMFIHGRFKLDFMSTSSL